jgi:hypothetical protein
MKQTNEKYTTVSIVNGKIVKTEKPNNEYKDEYKNESLDNTVKLFDNNKIVSLPLYKPISKKDKSNIEFYPSMSVNEYNNKTTILKPLSLIEYTLKGFKLPLNLITDTDVKAIKSNSIDSITIRNVTIPIYKGTLDLRVWISKTDTFGVNIDDKTTTAKQLYDEQQKEESKKAIRSARNKRYQENKKNGVIKTTISSKDYLSLHIINHIGHKANLPAIDLWQNSHIITQYDIDGKAHIVSVNTPNGLTVSDDSIKYACAYLKLYNQKLNVEKYMRKRLDNFFNTHKSRVVTAIDKNRQKLIKQRQIEEVANMQNEMIISRNARVQKSKYILQIHECSEQELVEINYSKYLSNQIHLSSMIKTNETKTKHNMHN